MAPASDVIRLWSAEVHDTEDKPKLGAMQFWVGTRKGGAQTKRENSIQKTQNSDPVRYRSRIGEYS